MEARRGVTLNSILERAEWAASNVQYEALETFSGVFLKTDISELNRRPWCKYNEDHFVGSVAK